MRISLLCLCFVLLFVGCGKRDPAEELHRAARMDKVDKISELIDAGYDVNKFIDGETPTHQAARSSKSKALALLLEKGADPKLKDSRNRDLWEIVYKKDDRFISVYAARCLAVLVDHGFENRIDLLEAVQIADCKELVEKLIAKGADVGMTDDYGWTPLHHAALKAHEDTCLVLLEAGADPNAESTRLLRKQLAREDGSSYDDWRYEAGSRPADVADLTGGRGHKSCSQIVKEYGGTTNDSLNNIRK